MNRPSSHFESQGSFSDFDNFNKENQPTHPRTQQKGFTQPPVSNNNPTNNTQIKTGNLEFLSRNTNGNF